ncbi:prolyl oligopeptidase family serine peptidase [Aquimarina sp. 2201CG1-2-11]|uniref:prolyl oligopeptidase family serine peptidase n=1 Tax=Aquimarina discodermiae TaxID=3231043 RepID=UPI003462353F
MKNIMRIVYFSLLLILMGCEKRNIYEYPAIKQQAVVDTIHGNIVLDPYRNLENLKDSLVLNWLIEQKKLSDSFIDKIPNKERLIKHYKELQEVNKYDVKQIHFTKSGQYFYLKREENEDFYKLYFKASVEENEQLLYNPKTYKTDYEINYFKPSWDGSKVVLSLRKKGDEFSELIIINVDDKKQLPFTIKNALPSFINIFWLPDNSGISYLSAPQIDNTKEDFLNLEARIHKLDGTSKVIFSKSNNPQINIRPEDLPILMINDPKDKYSIGAIAGVSSYYNTFYVPVEQINDTEQNWIPLFNKEDQIKQYQQLNDDLIYTTSKNTSNFKICKTSILHPNFENPQVLVSEKKEEVIKSFKIISKGLVYTTTKNGVESKLYFVNHKGQEQTIPLPIPAGKLILYTKGKDQDFLEVKIEGWIDKERRFRYDFVEQKFYPSDIFPLNESKSHKDIKVEELTIPSHDYEEVPLSLIYKKNLIKDGKNPVLMIGYGAYGYVFSPVYSQKFMTWVEEGGIIAIAHVRGGGEKGDAWHKGGFKKTKSNSWKDLIACAEYLINEKYTSAKNLAINGGSAGGITVGRAMTERPDLFAAAILQVGKLNSLRGEFGTNGKNNTKEFGSVADSLEFKALYEMDVYQSIEKGKKYPGTLIKMGVKDSRVAPWHSAKFAARLQECNVSDNPTLLHVDFDKGHGHVDSKTKRMNSNIEVLIFALWQTGHPDYQPMR